MTWSYIPANLATSKKDATRLLIGDTVSTDPQLQDEEIAYFLTTRSTIYGAAAECCRSLQAKFSRSVDYEAGGTKSKYSQMAKAYGLKAAEFEMKSAITGGAMPYSGGISVSDKERQQQDADRVRPQFQVGMEDNLMHIGSSGNENATDATDPNSP